MRINVVHMAVFVGLLNLVMIPLIGLDREPTGPRLLLALVAGAIMMLALAGPILRRLCVWPLVPRCPSCGAWVPGFHRALRQDDLLLISGGCEHAFAMRGEWVRPPFRSRGRIARSLIEEMGWCLREDGRVFRFASDYAADLLDEQGRTAGRRRARWPFWFVRWTDR